MAYQYKFGSPSKPIQMKYAELPVFRYQTFDPNALSFTSQPVVPSERIIFSDRHGDARSTPNSIPPSRAASVRSPSPAPSNMMSDASFDNPPLPDLDDIIQQALREQSLRSEHNPENDEIVQDEPITTEEAELVPVRSQASTESKSTGSKSETSSKKNAKKSNKKKKKPVSSSSKTSAPVTSKKSKAKEAVIVEDFGANPATETVATDPEPEKQQEETVDETIAQPELAQEGYVEVSSSPPADHTPDDPVDASTTEVSSQEHLVKETTPSDSEAQVLPEVDQMDEHADKDAIPESTPDAASVENTQAEETLSRNDSEPQEHQTEPEEHSHSVTDPVKEEDEEVAAPERAVEPEAGHDSDPQASDAVEPNKPLPEADTTAENTGGDAQDVEVTEEAAPEQQTENDSTSKEGSAETAQTTEVEVPADVTIHAVTTMEDDGQVAAVLVATEPNSTLEAQSTVEDGDAPDPTSGSEDKGGEADLAKEVAADDVPATKEDSTEDKPDDSVPADQEDIVVETTDSTTAQEVLQHDSESATELPAKSENTEDTPESGDPATTADIRPTDVGEIENRQVEDATEVFHEVIVTGSDASQEPAAAGTITKEDLAMDDDTSKEMAAEKPSTPDAPKDVSAKEVIEESSDGTKDLEPVLEDKTPNSNEPTAEQDVASSPTADSSPNTTPLEEELPAEQISGENSHADKAPVETTSPADLPVEEHSVEAPGAVEAAAAEPINNTTPTEEETTRAIVKDAETAEGDHVQEVLNAESPTEEMPTKDPPHAEATGEEHLETTKPSEEVISTSDPVIDTSEIEAKPEKVDEEPHTVEENSIDHSNSDEHAKGGAPAGDPPANEASEAVEEQANIVAAENPPANEAAPEKPSPEIESPKEVVQGEEATEQASSEETAVNSVNDETDKATVSETQGLSPEEKTAAVAAGIAAATASVAEKKRRKHRHRDVSPEHLNTQKGHLLRHRGEGGLLKNAIGQSIDTAKRERDIRHATPEYQEKIRRRKERREKEEVAQIEERRQAREVRRKEDDEKRHSTKERHRSADGEKETTRRERRRRRDSPGSENGSAPGSSTGSATGRPRLQLTGESFVGKGPLLLINMRKAGGYDQEPTKESRHYRHHHRTGTDPGPVQNGPHDLQQHHHHHHSTKSRKEDDVLPITKVVRRLGLFS